MKVALVHDWLTGMRGGEKVLELFCEIFPAADIFTLVHIKGKVSPKIESHRIFTSFLQKMPCASAKYRYYLPLMPRAIESLDLSGHDLVISTSHCVAKGCRPKPGALHICYCFTPMRYIWDQYENYFGANCSFPVRQAMGLIRPYLQSWDVRSAERVNNFVAISRFVADRIRNYYGRDTQVIYPPVDTEFYTPGESNLNSENKNIRFYLMISALAPYKRIDLAIEAFNRLGKPLKIIGSGQSEKALRSQAKSNIELLGWKDDNDLLQYYRACAGLIFPGVEDFGIVPLEAMSCGKPVIARRAGGALETVVDRKTGVFFDRQQPDSLAEAVMLFEQMDWNAAEIRKQALRFSKEEFRANVKKFFHEKVPPIEFRLSI